MQAQQNNKINEYDFAALDEIKPKEFNLNDSLKELLFNILPLIGFVLFIIILFSAVIPNIQQMNAKLAEIEKLKEQDATLRDRITKIRALGEQNVKLYKILDKINEIVPTGNTQVVKFSDRIASIASANTLTNTKRNVGEMIIVSDLSGVPDPSGINKTTGNAKTDLPLSEIPVKFDISGNYNNIREFFKALYKSNDFFVVEQMSLNLGKSDLWFGEISLVKYQMTPNKAFDPVLAYGGISENAVINPEVIKFLEQKFIGNVFDPQLNPTNSPTPTPKP